MIPSDRSGPAEESASKLKAAGIASFWDAKRDLGREFANVVTLPGNRKVAWDIYFLFGPDADWNDKPPTPIFWMHQLANDERCLDGTKFKDNVQAEMDNLPKHLVFLTRDGCAASPEMKRGLDAALKDLKWSSGYEVIDVASLKSDDVRTGYGTPTVLLDGKDLFGMQTPAKPAAPS